MKISLWAGLTALAVSLGAAAGGDSLLPKRKGETEFLPVDRAFELGPLEWKDNRLWLEWQIAPNYYLYRDRLKFTLAGPASGKLGAPQLPAAEKYEDQYFGATAIYRNSLHAELPLANVQTGTVKLTVVYQGCADAGLCYPPQTRTLEVRR